MPADDQPPIARGRLVARQGGGLATRSGHPVVRAEQLSDVVSRIMFDRMSKNMKQPIIVENRPGAGGNSGTGAAAKAAPDGYTLVGGGSGPVAANIALYKVLGYDPEKDFEMISPFAGFTIVVVASKNIPIHSLKELVDYAKANPGKLNYGSVGIGSSQHLAGEFFSQINGVKMTHVPYRGSNPALVDMLSGQCQVMFDNMPSSLPHIKSGKLRALAVTTAARSAALPDVPTVAEFVPGYEASSWYGIGAPKDTPAEIIDRLNKEINAGLADAKIKGRLADLGTAPSVMTPSEFGQFVADEVEKWGKVVRAAHLRAG